MHKATKCQDQQHLMPSGQNCPKIQAQTKSNSSNSGVSTAGKVRISGNSDFRCNSCNRSFNSGKARRAHIEAKHYPITTAVEIQRAEKAFFRCDVCGRCNFRSENAMNDHKRNSGGHQAANLQRAPPKASSSSGTRADQGQPHDNRHTLPITADKMVQCNLCSCISLNNKAYDSYLFPPSSEGQKQQNIPLFNAENHDPLALGYHYYSGNAAPYQFWHTYTDSQYAIDATN